MTLPLFVVTVELLPKVTLSAALSTTLSLLLLEVMSALFWKMMSSAAVSVRVALPPPVLLMSVETVMSPSCVPVVPVVMVTLVPALSDVSITPASICALFPVGVNVAELYVPFDVVPPLTLLTISTLRGSSNQVPALPLVALAYAIPDAVRNSLPEVSTKPPLPETAPPLASMRPPK